MNWKECWQTLLGILFPSKFICPFCWQTAREVGEKGLCGFCIEKIMRISQREETCPQCGYFTAGEECFNCKYWLNSALKVASVVPYEGIFRDLVYNFKYKGQKELARPLGTLMAYRVKSLGITGRIGIVVPIPLYPGREMERGYNQSLLLAKVVAEQLQKPLWSEVLVRKKFLTPQTQLGRKERLKNLTGAFEYSQSKQVKGSSILLVDDIVTTGATLLSCANALQKAGAREIYGVTWAAGYNVRLLKTYAGNWL